MSYGDQDDEVGESKTTAEIIRIIEEVPVGERADFVRKALGVYAYLLKEDFLRKQGEGEDTE